MESVMDRKDRKADIMAANQTFMAAVEKGATSLSELYTADAQLFPPNSEVIEGNQAIGAFWKAVYESGIKKAKLETTEALEDGDVIVECGQYTLYGDGDTQLDRGKYMVVWKKENNTWKLHRDIFNTSMPAATASV